MVQVTRRQALAGAAATGTLPLLAGRTARAAGEKLRIGLIIPTSGPLQITGAPVVTGAQIAVDLVNKAGGVNGQPVELVIKDSKASATNAVAMARELISDGVKLILGGLITPEAQALAPVLAEAGGMLVTIGAAGMNITHQDFNKAMFRATDQDFMEINMLAQFAAERYPGVLSWHGVVADTAASRSSADLFGALVVEAFGKKGLKAKYNGTIPIAFSATDARQQISTIMSSDTEGLYESIYGQLGGTFWQQGAAFGLQKKVRVVFDRGMEWPTVRALKRNLPGNLWLMSYWYAQKNTQFPLSVATFAEYQARSNGDELAPNLLYSGSTGIQTIVDACRAAGGATDAASLIHALESGATINTVRGPITYRGVDHQAQGNIGFVEVEGMEGDPGFKVVDYISAPGGQYMEPAGPGTEFKYP